MFSVENLLRSFEVLANMHMSSAERNEIMCKDISSGSDMKRKKPFIEDILKYDTNVKY